MSNHTGPLERVWDFTAQVLKQDIDKNLPNKESIFMKEKKWIGWKIQNCFCNGYYCTTNWSGSISKTDTAVEKLYEEAHKHAAFIHF